MNESMYTDVINYFRTMRLGNRVLGDAVQIIRRYGLFNRVLITPEDPEDFIARARGISGMVLGSDATIEEQTKGTE